MVLAEDWIIAWGFSNSDSRDRIDCFIAVRRRQRHCDHFCPMPVDNNNIRDKTMWHMAHGNMTAWDADFIYTLHLLHIAPLKMRKLMHWTDVINKTDGGICDGMIDRRAIQIANPKMAPSMRCVVEYHYKGANVCYSFQVSQSGGRCLSVNSESVYIQ